MLIPTIVLAVLTSAAEISEAIANGALGDRFALDATVISENQAYSHDFAVQDGSGTIILAPADEQDHPVLHPGMRIRAQGTLVDGRTGHIAASCSSVAVLGRGTPPAVDEVDFRQILSGACDSRVIRTTGTLRDYFVDEIDKEFVYLILNRDGETLYAVCRTASADIPKLDAWIGCPVSLRGLCDPRPSGSRRKIGRIIRLDDLDVSVSADVQTPADPFAAPLIGNLGRLQATELPTLGRRRANGRVLAVWGTDSMLLRLADGSISRIDLAKGPLPKFGTSVEVVGFPETDLYRINFSRAVWRPAARQPEETDTVTDITARTLLSNFRGQAAINASCHGQMVRIRGIVRGLPVPGNERLQLESDGCLIPVDTSANPSTLNGVVPGSEVDVSGTCVLEIENWRSNLVFPHIKEVMIVTRTPDDIVVIRRPPWWTPARLTIVIGSLLAVLIGILIWNRALKALAEKRGKALANEELERLESDLKVCERTRLAVELHDSIAQNLTGVSMEIDTALRGDEPLPPAAAQHMGRALRTIDSCRGELRNCLWDLRSQALEEDDMNKAIRLTLSQTIGKANLSVRFNVPRSRFTDNTAHTLLRIIRELAANAVRHGHATEIKVAGSIENDVLKFSVRDNGCGFDPDACPGVLDGHFGLQGVRERVASFEGNVQIESSPGKGTRVSVAINAPQAEDEQKI